ncbi:class D sortase [Priestia megaterium]|uniref:class D sortase n=1 Tax=Priestia megaterium TaxID=1404 RepID=UPI003672E4C6
MRKWSGLSLIAIGLIIGTYYYLDWNKGRSSAEELTNKEIKHYEESADQKTRPQKKVTPTQTPASQVQHEAGEHVANLIIPAIKKKYSVYWGADEDVLKKGVGMFVSDLTTTPSGNGHTVLSGHRDTVFTGLGTLKEDDQLLVEYEDHTYTYKIKKTWITDAEDRTVIVKKEKSVLTLTTCYPFEYIGHAPDRYIIEAELI